MHNHCTLTLTLLWFCVFWKMLTLWVACMRTDASVVVEISSCCWCGRTVIVVVELCVCVYIIPLMYEYSQLDCAVLFSLYLILLNHRSSSVIFLYRPLALLGVMVVTGIRLTSTIRHVVHLVLPNCSCCPFVLCAVFRTVKHITILLTCSIFIFYIYICWTTPVHLSLFSCGCM